MVRTQQRADEEVCVVEAELELKGWKTSPAVT